jgi:hypothetical protein
MTAGSIPPEFQKLADRLAEINDRYQRGKLSDAAYQEQIQSLTLHDASGAAWWLGGEPGTWHRWDGQAWVRTRPPTMQKRSAGGPVSGMLGSRPLLLGCGAGVLLVLAVAAVLLLGGLAEYRSAPKIVEEVQPGAASGAYSLSQAQQTLVAELGAPQAFSMLFYEEELEDGSLGDVRFETWSYYTDGLEVTFINGDQVAEEPLEIGASGDIFPIPYRPEQFMAYMSLDEVVAAAGLTTYLVVPLEKELVRGGEVYFADELTFGLKDDELLYLEALALQVEG